MADYEIGVHVNVKDSELDALEKKINSLKTTNIRVDLDIVGEKNLKRSIDQVMSKVGKDYKKKYKGSLTDSIVGTADKVKDSSKGYDKLAKSIKTLAGFSDKDINLNIKISDGVQSELNTLHEKLKEIKSTASSMGSVKIKIADNLKMEEGQLVVSSGQAEPISVKKLESLVKKNAKAQRDLQNSIRGVVDPVIRTSTEEKIQKLKTERENYLDIYKKLNSVSETEKISLDNYIDDTVNSNTIDKTIADLKKKKQEYDNILHSYGKSDTPPLNHRLNEGYQRRTSIFNSILSKIDEEYANLHNLQGKELEAAQSRINSYAKEANRHAKYLNDPSQSYLKSDSKFSKSRYLGIDASASNIYEEMGKMANELAKGSKYTTHYNEATKKMTANITRDNGLFETYQIKYNTASGMADSSILKVNRNIKPISTYFSELGTKFKSLSQYLIGDFGFDILQAGFQSGIASIKELDSAMTELKKTSTGTKEEYRDFTKQANIDAKNIGSTTTQITNSAADWSRLGYSLEDSATMAKQTGILKNVSEFETIEDATSAMVGIMQAYKVDPEDADIVVDKLNKIGNTQPISTSGLASALQIAGSALEVQGNTMEESMAIVTAMNSSIQDPNQAARAARTVSMRLSGVSSETLAAEGEDVEGLIESVPKLESKIKSLTAVNGKMGVSLTDSVGNFRSTYDILLDIAERWEEIKESDAKDGKNRANDLLETMANFKPVCTEMCIEAYT